MSTSDASHLVLLPHIILGKFGIKFPQSMLPGSREELGHWHYNVGTVQYCIGGIAQL